MAQVSLFYIPDFIMIFFFFFFFFWFDSIRFVPCALISIKLCVIRSVIRSVIHSGIHSGIRHVPLSESQFRLWDYCHPWSRWECLCVHFLNVSIMKNFSVFFLFFFALSFCNFFCCILDFTLRLCQTLIRPESHWIRQNRIESYDISWTKKFCSRVSSHRSASHRIESKTKTKRMTSSTRRGGGKWGGGGISMWEFERLSL